MQKVHHNKVIVKVLLIVVLTLASALIFACRPSSETSVYGLRENSINVSVQVSPSGPPSVDSIGPLTGSTAGGTEITIRGDNLDGVGGVFLGDSGPECMITFISKEEIKCIMPPHGAGYVDIVVEVPGYKSPIWVDAFQYLADSELPLPPNTGLFRLGRHIVTLYEVLTILTIIGLWIAALWFIIWKRSHQRKTDKKA